MPLTTVSVRTTGIVTDEVDNVFFLTASKTISTPLTRLRGIFGLILRN